MFWLRSVFEISSVEDLKLLARIYAGVAGEINVEHEMGESYVDWCDAPFEKAVEKYARDAAASSKTEKAGKEKAVVVKNLFCRLVGPETLNAVSIPTRSPWARTFCAEQMKKIPAADVATLALIEDGKKEVEHVMQVEMERKFDLAYIPNWTAVGQLKTIDQVMLVCLSAPLVTHVFPTSLGCVVSCSKGYNQWVPLGKPAGPMGHSENDMSSLMYNKDDGFCSVFLDVKRSKIRGELEALHNRWKARNYKSHLLDTNGDSFLLYLPSPPPPPSSLPPSV